VRLPECRSNRVTLERLSNAAVVPQAPYLMLRCTDGRPQICLVQPEVVEEEEQSDARDHEWRHRGNRKSQI